MDLFILSADNSDDLLSISEELSEKKFKAIEAGDTFILMRKRRYGNVLIQVVCLLLALQVSVVFLFINVAYFTYSYLWASPHVLITTEKVGDDGRKLEFNSMDEVLNKANAIL
ncbi:hypothetical protein [Methanobrevibacter sp.]|uniref:hypothetical protein n=1 Tax=Methanobrevibacter sp. TaxID=66852 RepID=UPI0026DF4C90|nr:hypothetical protein [Methanobrevibacter sp.]MDO5860534.1 hypothetical protein [Methanobrevibacter sp.]